MSGVRWEEPPPQMTGRRMGKPPFGSDIIDDLRANPGRWAVITRPTQASATTMTRNICIGRVPALRGCEAVSRTGGGEYRVYVRWPEGGAE